ncbi:MAG TPA: ATP-binding cassette domain-containing protein [Mycobacteriales bacterium]
MSVFRCEDLSRTYGSGRGTVVAVHGATCQVPPAARIALVGPSGSGKSTMLHLMAGLEQPTAGTRSWPALGGDVTREPWLVGVVFQAPSLLLPLDVVENVELPLLLAGTGRAEARARAHAALDELDLADLAPALPEELSGGQAQRVAVARMLAGRPRLILADEPTGQLDHETGAHVLDVMFHTADRLGAAVVVSTHDPAVADLLAERWTMADGRLTAGGKVGAR